MVNYLTVKNAFEKEKCKLLMSEEEFNLKPRKVTEKYKYVASCNHEHEAWFNVFTSRKTGVICSKCVILRDTTNQLKKCKITPLHNLELEYKNLTYLREIIQDYFDIKFNVEGCLADCSIRPKGITEDLWIMIQIKSTGKPVRGYSFKCNEKYKNCLVLCICNSDKKMWLFNRNLITNKNKIEIGLNKSKYDEFEITKDNIFDKLYEFYNLFPKFIFDEINTPISKCQQLEQEYVKYREKMISFIKFENNERQGLVYDFMINDLKIQEKVISYNINKNNGCDENHNRKAISYQKGDNDFYWLNINNKKHFYIIPENELITRNYINVDKISSIYLNPEVDDKHWSKDNLFDYTNINEEKIKLLLGL